MFFTSLILMAGFAVLAGSHFQLNAGMGLMTAIVIALAAGMDLLFLTPLLLCLEGSPDATAPPAAGLRRR